MAVTLTSSLSPAAAGTDAVAVLAHLQMLAELTEQESGVTSASR